MGVFDLETARTLDELADDFAVIPIAEAARAAFPALELDAEQAGDVRVGRPLDLGLATITALFDPAGEFLALYASADPIQGPAKAVAVFV